MSKLRIGQATCPYCGYVTTTGGISTHVRHCSKNPDMIAKKRQKVIPTEVALDSLPAHLRDLIHPTDTGKELEGQGYSREDMKDAYDAGIDEGFARVDAITNNQHRPYVEFKDYLITK